MRHKRLMWAATSLLVILALVYVVIRYLVITEPRPRL